MSTLLVEPLLSGIVFSQKIKISKSVSIAHIRPWIYIEGTLATGDFQCQIFQGATLLKTSLINYLDINDVKTETYAHGYIRFDFDSLILHRAEQEEKTEYTFEFSMINYTNAAGYIAICRQWEYPTGVVYGGVDLNGDALNDQVEPAGYQIYEYRSQ